MKNGTLTLKKMEQLYKNASSISNAPYSIEVSPKAVQLLERIAYAPWYQKLWWKMKYTVLDGIDKVKELLGQEEK